jgi:hypothetical protein
VRNLLHPEGTKNLGKGLGVSGIAQVPFMHGLTAIDVKKYGAIEIDSDVVFDPV